MIHQSFFSAPSEHIAPLLLGQLITMNQYTGRILDIEAYGGDDDPASHAFKRKTPRNEIMFGPPGYIYIYMIYGMYYCFNIVTHPIDIPGSLFIRAIDCSKHGVINGPGKLCRAWGIDLRYHGQKMFDNPLCGITIDRQPVAYTTSKRIGITKDDHRQWRFKVAT